MNNKELDKFDYLIGFVNEIAEIVFSPDEYLDVNTKDSCCLSLGYSLDKNGNPVIYDIEGDNSVSAVRDTLKAIISEVKSTSGVDYTKQWEKLRGE